ncbi:MAG TPA: hypothetical protein VL948_12715 [Verrucomicrobiae bacterium]|nr:hypothetical protein [Verrucomicrobiae bacterium]
MHSRAYSLLFLAALLWAGNVPLATLVPRGGYHRGQGGMAPATSK